MDRLGILEELIVLVFALALMARLRLTAVDVLYLSLDQVLQALDFGIKVQLDVFGRFFEVRDLTIDVNALLVVFLHLCHDLVDDVIVARHSLFDCPFELDYSLLRIILQVLVLFDDLLFEVTELILKLVVHVVSQIIERLLQVLFDETRQLVLTDVLFQHVLQVMLRDTWLDSRRLQSRGELTGPVRMLMRLHFVTLLIFGNVFPEIE